LRIIKKLHTTLSEFESTIQSLMNDKANNLSTAVNIGGNNITQSQDNEKLKSLLAASETKYNKLKVQAESVVEKANKHIVTLTANHSKDLTAWKAKFVTLETRAHCAEQTLAAKEFQNQELLRICDEMIAKLEQK